MSEDISPERALQDTTVEMGCSGTPLKIWRDREGDLWRTNRRGNFFRAEPSDNSDDASRNIPFEELNTRQVWQTEIAEQIALALDERSRQEYNSGIALPSENEWRITAARSSGLAEAAKIARALGFTHKSQAEAVGDGAAVGRFPRLIPGPNAEDSQRSDLRREGSRSITQQPRDDLMAGDSVLHPSHYTSDPSGIECITITRHRNFDIGNAIKYLWRAGLKGSDSASRSVTSKQVEDLNKAIFYINDEIERLGGTPKWAPTETLQRSPTPGDNE